MGSGFYALFLPEIPFLIRTGHIFILCLILAVGGSLLSPKPKEAGITLRGVSFKTDASYNFASGLIILILTGLYWYFW